VWFYIPAAIFILLVAWWISRSNLFRHLRRGGGGGAHEPYQSSQHWEGDGGTSGLGGG
jgi:hypothetical protein